jgi:hypothetical protein
VAEGENGVSSAGAQDAAGAGAAGAGSPGRGAAGAVVPERGSVEASVPERGSAGHALHGGILGVADRFRDDDGSADPAAAAALSAFAAGTGSEHAALVALAAARLLVPVLAEAAPAAADPQPVAAAAGEKSSDLALPTLVGRDGRRALPVFTSLEALARWQPSARPVPADSAQVWRAAAEDSCAVIIDVAGPVPLAVEGARLTALAEGSPVPPPHEDPDIQAEVETAITEVLATLPAPALGASASALGAAALPAPAPSSARGPAIGAPITGALVGFALHPGVDGGDLLIELTVAPMVDAQKLASQVGSAILQRLGSRLRRGVALALSPNPGHPA